MICCDNFLDASTPPISLQIASSCESALLLSMDQPHASGRTRSAGFSNSRLPRSKHDP